MIVIAEIYTQLGIDDRAPPHYFELENIAEMFIPSAKNELTEIIHLVPKQQNLSPSKIEQLLATSENLTTPYESTRLLLSRGRSGGGARQAPVRFHILSASLDDETNTASRLLEFFVQEMEQLGV